MPLTYKLGPRSLRVVAPNLSPSQAEKLAEALGPAFHKFGITTRRRAAMAVAQFAHESAGFRTTEEFADGHLYEGRRDLGNTHRGDGKRFKGRGFIQVTGRLNYAAVGKAMGVNFLTHPALMASDRYAAMASCWWWHAHGLNELADTRSVEKVTRRINGGLNGLASRRLYYARARVVARFLVPKRRA